MEDMPKIDLTPEILMPWGEKWIANGRFTKKESMQFGRVVDKMVGNAFSFLCRGNVKIGNVKLDGSVRIQHFDVGYLPRGEARFLFDSKTLNTSSSIAKNFLNMVNDITAESVNVHHIHSNAISAYIFLVPTPSFNIETRKRFTPILENLAKRVDPNDKEWLAEAISLVMWNPMTGEIETNWPEPESNLRIEKFSEIVQNKYIERFGRDNPENLLF